MSALPEAEGRTSITGSEAFELLPGSGFGHVNFTRHALPSSIPVRYLVDGTEVLIRVEARSGLERVLDATVVSLEVDVKDATSRASWRVVLRGPAMAGVSPAKDLVRLHPSEVTGHQLPISRP